MWMRASDGPEVETIPESATMLLLAGGIAGLIAVRRKKH